MVMLLATMNDYVTFCDILECFWIVIDWFFIFVIAVVGSMLTLSLFVSSDISLLSMNDLTMRMASSDAVLILTRLIVALSSPICLPFFFHLFFCFHFQIFLFWLFYSFFLTSLSPFCYQIVVQFTLFLIDVPLVVNNLWFPSFLVVILWLEKASLGLLFGFDPIFVLSDLSFGLLANLAYPIFFYQENFNINDITLLQALILSLCWDSVGFSFWVESLSEY